MAKFQLPDGNVIVAEQSFIDVNFPDAVLIPEPVQNRAAVITARIAGINASRAELDAEAAALQAELAGL